jgi:hypothetical protein
MMLAGFLGAAVVVMAGLLVRLARTLDEREAEIDDLYIAVERMDAELHGVAPVERSDDVMVIAGQQTVPDNRTRFFYLN